MILKEYTITVDEPMSYSGMGGQMMPPIKTYRAVSMVAPYTLDSFTIFGDLWVATRFIRVVQIKEIK